MTITIDNKTIEVSEDNTILDVTEKEGIYIPTLCHYKYVPDDASCMICVVKDKKTNELIPACSTYVKEGMDIETNSEEIVAFRKRVVKLLLKEHRAECEAPCVKACPAKYNIPLLHKYLSNGMLKNAVSLVTKDMEGEGLECYNCDAKCEQACNRALIDSCISIQGIREFLAHKKIEDDNSEPIQKKEYNKYTFHSKLGYMSKEDIQKRLVISGADGKREDDINGFLSVNSEAKLCLQCQCAANDDCQLREIASYLQVEDDGEKLTNTPIEFKVNRNSDIVFESTKCIKCGLCTRINNDEDPRAALCFKNSGINIVVSEAIGVNFNNIPYDKAQDYIKVCPTGALHKYQG